ncbi:MAG TPA: hypothetical protein VMU50_02935 [Polyangia bacterium]|nr:hypothetical protein [Polyangia bacterium]
MRDLLERLNSVGFERTRRALAGLSLSLFLALYLLVSLNAPEGWGPAFLALAGCYLVGFMAVVAEWFWGRWFAAGLGWSGLMVAVASLAMVGWTPPLAIYGGLHGLIVLCLTGKRMAGRYDLQAAWRQRYGMDEYAVARLRKTVTRAAASLPSLILYALGPKEPGQGMAVMAVGIGALLLAAASLRGLVLLRTWGVLAAGAAAIALGTLAASVPVSTLVLPLTWLTPVGFALGSVLPATLLGLAVLPFLGPALRFLRAR